MRRGCIKKGKPWGRPGLVGGIRAGALLGFLSMGALFPTLGCVSENAAGTGHLALSAGGGQALAQGFPHSEGAVTHAFVDGWALTFTKYVLVIGDIKLLDPASGLEVGGFKGPVILDLKAGSGQNHEVALIRDLPARRLDIAFSFLAATAQSENRNAAPGDVAAMIGEGLSFLVAGQASRGGRTIDFNFGLAVAARYHDCLNGKDGTRGIAIERNKTTGAVIYAHALHLFWDTLAAGDEDLRFEAFAAMAGPDNLLTAGELAQQDLTDLRDGNGDPLLDNQGNRVLYNDGGILPPNRLNLKAFLEHAARSSVHFNGVGLCASESL